ncbi:MAG TPA: arsenic resistance N-acetyltransferase ArsN2 [Myxococcaceae bacterium]|nr:arsenic resistance N-acetyltransferase ArsN2 [Myxococcaceae bacterium]
MEVKLRRASANDAPAVEAVLRERKLPLVGVGEQMDRFWVAEEGGSVVGTAGLEVHGRYGLLRSLAVLPNAGGSGTGSRLTWQVLEEAVAQGLREVYLLTTTAVEFFPRFGFVRIRRKEVPADLLASSEFEVCPSTAVTMRWSPTSSGMHEPPSVI